MENLRARAMAWKALLDCLACIIAMIVYVYGSTMQERKQEDARRDKRNQWLRDQLQTPRKNKMSNNDSLVSFWPPPHHRPPDSSVGLGAEYRLGQPSAVVSRRTGKAERTKTYRRFGQRTKVGKGHAEQHRALAVSSFGPQQAVLGQKTRCAFSPVSLNNGIQMLIYGVALLRQSTVDPLEANEE